MVMSGGSNPGPVFGGGKTVKAAPGAGLRPDTIEGAIFASDGSFDKVVHFQFDQHEATVQLVNSGYRPFILTTLVDTTPVVQKIWAQSKADVRRYSKGVGTIKVAPKPWLPVNLKTVVVAPEDDGGSYRENGDFIGAPELEYLYEKEE